jgi:hypothetical protein
MRYATIRLAGMLLILLPRWAEAHPLDEVVQGAYLTLAPGEVRLELDLTPGIEVAGAFLQALDANADRIITEVEMQGYAEDVLARSTLTLDDVALSWMLNEVNMPPYQSLELGGGTVSIHAVAQHPYSVGAHVLSYRNDHQPAASRRMANVFLQPGEGWQYRITGQQHSDDGRQLTVTYTVARQ